MSLYIMFLMFLISVLPHVYSQSELVCPCDADRNALNSQWGSWTSFPTCTGTCGNNVLTGGSNCFVYTNNRTFVATFPCFRRQISGCDLCVGKWSEWGSIGQCDAVCGFGMQLESRTCYLRSTAVNIRSDRCAGDLGVFDQYRNSTCSRFNNCEREVRSSTTSSRTRTEVESTAVSHSTQSTIHSTTVATHSTVSASRSTTTVEIEKKTLTEPTFLISNETRNASRGSSTFSTLLPKDDNSSTHSLTSAPKQPTEEFDTVILAAVLGSVAIICVTIVAIAFAVITTKNRKHVKRTASYSTNKGNSVIHTVSRARGQEINYERRGSGFQSKSFSTFPEVLRPAANGMHETTFVEGGVSQLPAATQGANLQRSSPTKLQESVYLSVEER